MPNTAGEQAADRGADRQQRRPGRRGERVGRAQHPAGGDLRQDRHPHRVEHPADAHLDRRQHEQQPHLVWGADQQEAQHDHGAQQVGDDQDALAVEAVGQHAGERAGHEGAEHADGEQAAERRARPGELRQERGRGDDVEPIAEQAGDLGEPQQAERAVGAQQLPVAAAAGAALAAGAVGHAAILPVPAALRASVGAG